MNWDALGATAELLAALGVIISLAYLAKQVKDNTDSVKADTYQRFCDAVREINMLFLTNESLIHLSGRLLNNERELSDLDRRKSVTMVSTLLRHTDNIFYQYRVGTLDREQFVSMRMTLEVWMESDLVRDYWKTIFRQYYAGDLRAYTDKLVQAVESRKNQGKAPGYSMASVFKDAEREAGSKE